MENNFSEKGQPNQLNQPVPAQQPKKIFWIFFIASVLIAFLAGGYFLAGKQNKSNQQKTITPDLSPTATSEVNVIPIQEKGSWVLQARQISKYVITSQLHLINKNTQQDSIIGTIIIYNAQGNANFSLDGTKVVFVNYENGEQSIDPKQIILSLYSIPDNKIVKKITLDEIGKALPQLSIPGNANLSFIALSPDNTRVAASYGYILEPSVYEDIVIVNFQTGKISLANVKGLVQQWKDNSILQYETADGDKKYNSGLPLRIIKEVIIP